MCISVSSTDWFRSVRILVPSAFCELYALRPSYDRLFHGAVNSLEGQEYISSVLGPMANSLSVKIFTTAILDAKPWRQDPLVLKNV
jgi:amidase